MAKLRVRANLGLLGLLLFPLRGGCYEELEPEDAGRAWTGNDHSSEDAELPDKVGAEVHLTKAERAVLRKVDCGMCKAILSEMHLEVAKHSMTSKGYGSEVKVWETSNAICLAMLQKYRLSLQGQTLEKKMEDEEDEEYLERMQSAGTPVVPQDYMRSMLVLKMGCSRWVEDYGGDTAGYVYRVVKEGTQDANRTAEDFCSTRLSPPLCGAGKKAAEKREKAKEKKRSEKRKELMNQEASREAERKKDDPFEKLPEDSRAGLQRMLEMAKDDPLHYMDEASQRRVQQGQADLRCDVCLTVLEETYAGILKKPKSMRGEDLFLSILESACEGGRDLSLPNYFGVEPPPLPPLWTDRVRPKLLKKSNRYALRPKPKKALKDRSSWRELAAKGQQKPPSPDVSEGDMMMTMACKAILEPARMAEVLFERVAGCGQHHNEVACNAPLDAAKILCKAADETACVYEAATDRENGEL